MSSDRSTRAAVFEQLRQKRQRGEKNKYETEIDETVLQEFAEEDEQEKEKRPKKRSRAVTPVKKLSDFSGFVVGSEGPTVNSPVVTSKNEEVEMSENDNSVQLKNESSVVTSAEQKSLLFYCLDIYEDTARKPGDIYLIGKAKPDGSRSCASCCVRIRGIQRRIFVLPRQLRRDGVTKQETGVPITFEDVEEELTRELKRLRIKDFKIKKETQTKKYCLTGADVPKQAEYLVVRYPFHQPLLPVNFSGDTFSHVFGSTSTGLEIFLLECRLRLPCWLEIKKPAKSTAPFSWCNLEIDLENPEPGEIRVMTDVTIPPPPVNLLSLSVKTMRNPENGQKEVIAVGMWFLSCYFLDREKQDESKWRHICVMRKGAEHAHLFDFKMKVAKETFTKVRTEENERALLSCVLAEIQNFGADVLVGHDLWDFELPTLINRINEKIAPQLQRLGWLRRSYTGHRTFTRFDIHDVMGGRLVCDLKVMAMEFILRSKSYDLTELASQILNETRVEIVEEAVAEIYQSSEALINFAKQAVTDASICWRLMAKLCCLQLTSEITRIVGGVWSKTLAGGRAERTEFLLLHAFEASGYIAPEKHKLKKFAKEVEEVGDDEDETGAGSVRKKASYTGGLVLEPKKGLYDSYVLLLDFNSLYPSIIMEYNVCFTTIDQRKWTDGRDGAVVSDLPETGLPTGILPNEVRKLVESRKAVKQLMKDSRTTQERYQEYNIRQQALKITANSMYGCLGFSNSRFYAKPLAALITSQGREILTDTKHLVEKFHLEVIYGDTDSIMISTNCDNLDEVLALGRKIKAEVNKKYFHLELDIDGVYKKLLLYKKKKYAGLMVEASAAAAAANKGEVKLKREMKGLDIVRRDCPPVAVEAGSLVLDELLSDCETQKNLEKIYGYLSNLAEDMRNAKIPVEKYEVSKQLSRPPDQYGDKRQQPHVSVALRLNSNGRHLKQGDVVPYIICENGTVDAPMQRAYHRSELESNNELKIDVSYYLAQQVHPVVVRLLEPLGVSGADAVKVAECLGLDTTSYRRSVAASTAPKDGSFLYDDFSGCLPFTVKCPECKTDNEITSAFVNEEGVTRPSLQRCVNVDCSAALWKHRVMLLNRLTQLLRQFIKKHYHNWLVCEDCGLRTRHVVDAVGSKGKARCPSCNHFGLHHEYSAQNLYSQLAYYQHVFTWTAANSTLRGISKGNSTNDLRAVYGELKKAVDLVIGRNAYAQIDLGKLFKCFM